LDEEFTTAVFNFVLFLAEITHFKEDPEVIKYWEKLCSVASEVVSNITFKTWQEETDRRGVDFMVKAVDNTLR
jgi:hypothetical protein